MISQSDSVIFGFISNNKGNFAKHEISFVFVVLVAEDFFSHSVEFVECFDLFGNIDFGIYVPKSFGEGSEVFLDGNDVLCVGGFPCTERAAEDLFGGFYHDRIFGSG